MAKRKRSPDIDRLKEEFLELVDLLENRHKMALSDIASIIKEEATSFFKYADGDLPETKPEKIRQMIAEMRKLLKLKKLEKLEKISRNIIKTGYSTETSFTKTSFTEASSEVLEPVIKYETPPKEIDFELFSDDPCAEPEIPVGSKLGIRLIDISDCEWGKFHYILNTNDEPYLRRLHKNADNTYRLAAETDKYSDLHFEESKIDSVYKIVYVKYVPK